VHSLSCLRSGIPSRCFGFTQTFVWPPRQTSPLCIPLPRRSCESKGHHHHHLLLLLLLVIGPPHDDSPRGRSKLECPVLFHRLLPASAIPDSAHVDCKQYVALIDVCVPGPQFPSRSLHCACFACSPAPCLHHSPATRSLVTPVLLGLVCTCVSCSKKQSTYLNPG